MHILDPIPPDPILHLSCIGVGKYADKHISDLIGPPHDALAIRDLFVNAVENVNATVLKDVDATIANVRRALRKTLKGKNENDIVIAHYSGHGISDHGLTGHDTDVKKRTKSNIIPFKEVRELMDACKARIVLLTLDCCFSGQFISQQFNFESVDSSSPDSAKVILTACDTQELAYELSSGEHYGFLTKSILDVCTTREGEVDLAEITGEIRRRVSEYANQIGVEQTAVEFGYQKGENTLYLRPAAEKYIRPKPAIELHYATKPEPEFVGRKDNLMQLDHAFTDTDTNIISLTGFGGVGKSALARKWYDKHEYRSLQPNSIFWWGFYKKSTTVEDFINALLIHLITKVEKEVTDPKSILERYASMNIKLTTIINILSQKRHILILDGLEVMQEGAPGQDEPGRISDPNLREFLRRLADIEHQQAGSLTVVTSRLPVSDLKNWNESSYQDIDVTELAPEDARELLRNKGVKGDDSTLEEIAEKYYYHAHSLYFIADRIRDHHDGEAGKLEELPDMYTDNPNLSEREKKIVRILQEYEKDLSYEQKTILRILSFIEVPLTYQELLDFIQQFYSKNTFDLTASDEERDQVDYDALIGMHWINLDEILRDLTERKLLIKTEGKEYEPYSICREYFRNYGPMGSSRYEVSMQQAAIAFFDTQLEGKEDYNDEDAEKAKELMRYAFALEKVAEHLLVASRLIKYLHGNKKYQQIDEIIRDIKKQLNTDRHDDEYTKYLSAIIFAFREAQMYEAMIDYSNKLMNAYVKVQQDQNLSRQEKAQGKLGELGCLTTIAKAYADMEDLEATKEHLNRAMDIDISYFPNHPLIAQAHMHFGDLFCRRGQNEEGIKSYMNALEIYKKYHKGDHEDIIECLEKIGEVLMSSGTDLKKAKNYALMAYSMAERMYQGDHIKIADTLLLRGHVAWLNKEFEDALSHFQQGREMLEKIHAEPTAELAQCHNGIARCYQQFGQIKDAATYYQKAIQVYEQLSKEVLSLGIAISTGALKMYLDHDPENHVDMLKYHLIAIKYIKQNKHKAIKAVEYRIFTSVQKAYIELKNPKELTNLLKEAHGYFLDKYGEDDEYTQEFKKTT